MLTLSSYPLWTLSIIVIDIVAICGLCVFNDHKPQAI